MKPGCNIAPLVERCSSNPFSFDELSCHTTSIWLVDAAVATAFEGAPGADPDPELVLRASRTGPSAFSGPQAARANDRSEMTNHWRRVANMAAPEGDVVLPP